MTQGKEGPDELVGTLQNAAGSRKETEMRKKTILKQATVVSLTVLILTTAVGCSPMTILKNVIGFGGTSSSEKAEAARILAFLDSRYPW